MNAAVQACGDSSYGYEENSSMHSPFQDSECELGLLPLQGWSPVLSSLPTPVASPCQSDYFLPPVLTGRKTLCTVRIQLEDLLIRRHHILLPKTNLKIKLPFQVLTEHTGRSSQDVSEHTWRDTIYFQKIYFPPSLLNGSTMEREREREISKELRKATLFFHVAEYSDTYKTVSKKGKELILFWIQGCWHLWATFCIETYKN